MIKTLSKLSFLITGIFHYAINYIFFMINFAQGKHSWLVNNNSIGEANFEAVMMTLMTPFIVYGFYLYFKELIMINHL